MKLVILDRDGVINKDLFRYVENHSEFEIIPSSVKAISMLKKAGYNIAVATNQGGIGKGIYSATDLAGIHAKMLLEIRGRGGDIDRILFCPAKDYNHSWKKPNPGMLNEIVNYYPDVELPVYFIGDSAKDVIAASKTICTPLFVLTGNGENQKKLIPSEIKVDIFKDLYEATNYILG